MRTFFATSTSVVFALLLAFLSASPAMASDSAANVKLVFKNTTDKSVVASANLADSSRNWQVNVDPNSSNTIKFSVNAPAKGYGDFEVYISSSMSGQPYKDCYLDFGTKAQGGDVLVVHPELNDCKFGSEARLTASGNTVQVEFKIK